MTTLRALLETYPTDIRVVFKHFPLLMHDRARIAAEAVLAAHAQGRGQAMHALLFANAGKLSDADLRSLAATAEVPDLDRFWSEVSQGIHGARVDADIELAGKLAVTSTPSSFVNGVPQRGAKTFEQLREIHAAEIAVVDQMLARLAARGLIEISDQLAKRRTRRPASDAMSARARTAPAIALSAEQNSALNAIIGRIENRGFEAFLLHGVTGGGKTEVYLRAIERARDLGRRSLIIAPEISLTPQLLDRLHDRFPGRVGVLHSALTPAERWSQWQRVASGEIDVVVGARSAVFAPVTNLGLIVVDEEHDPSYKQEDGVRYNGRDVAVVRAKLLGCPVVLGSATPALESYENCRQGRYRLLEIRERVAGRPLPSITAVDLRQQHQLLSSSASTNSADGDGKCGERPLISGPLAEWLATWPTSGGSEYERLQKALRRVPANLHAINRLLHERLQQHAASPAPAGPS